MLSLKPHERIILPLDVSNINSAISLVNQLSPHVGIFKIGFEALYSTMVDFIMCPEQQIKEFVRKVRLLCLSIRPEKAFFDVKLHDIPNTVESAMKSLSRLGVRMLNMHASAGEEAIKKAVALKGMSKLFGVTVLTSIKEKECISIFGATPGEKVLQFADMLRINGADGIICAPAEGLLLRQHSVFDNMEITTPNVRPLWTMTPEEIERTKDDQDPKRQMTPRMAIKARIDKIIIGRPITNPPAKIGGPIEAAKLIANEIAEALQ